MSAGEVPSSRELPLGVGIGVGLREGQGLAHGCVDSSNSRIEGGHPMPPGLQPTPTTPPLNELSGLQT